MPLVAEAMRRSLGDGALDSVSRAIQRRDIVSDVTKGAQDFRTAISSWDNCMSVAYCKWTLIGIMVVGGLIVGSILWCIIRRICCGLACCCSCFNCFKCCGNCCGCCDPPRRKNAYMDDSYRQTNSHDGYNYGYKPQPSMVPVVVVPQASGALGATASASAAPQYAQYAEFDVKRGGEDALPAMPSWDDSNSKKIMVEEEVEMEPLKKPEPSPSPSPLHNPSLAAVGPMGGGAEGRGTPVSARGASSPSPVGPYGRPLERVPTATYGQQQSGFAPPPPQRSNTYADPYGQQQHTADPYGMPRSNSAAGYQGGRQTPAYDQKAYGQDQYAQDQYAQGQNAYSQDQYGAKNNYFQYGQQQQGQQDYDQGYDRGYQQDTPGYQQDHGYQQPQQNHQDHGYQQGHGYQQDHGFQQTQAYGQDYQNYPQESYNNNTHPQHDTNAYNTPASNAYNAPASNAYNTPSKSPSPRPQFVDMPAPPALDNFSGPGSPRLVNNAGFDFNSGFSRPQTPRGPAPAPMAGPLGPKTNQGFGGYGNDELHGV